jgi:hypothetical protein
MNCKSDERKANNLNLGISLGLALGAAFGVLIGVITKDIATWLAIGPACGMPLGIGVTGVMKVFAAAGCRRTNNIGG